jgi:uncharacterized protein YuzE
MICKSRSIINIALFALLISACPTNGQTKLQPEWKSLGFYYHRNNQVEMFYDPGTIKQVSKRIQQVWIKQIEHYEDEKAKQVGIEELTKNREILGFKLDGYDKYAYSTSLIEFDCSKRTARDSCIVDYDETGKIIGKECSEEMPFAPVRTELTIKLLKITCKQK